MDKTRVARESEQNMSAPRHSVGQSYSVQEFQVLEAAAGAEGMSVSAFIKAAALSKAGHKKA